LKADFACKDQVFQPSPLSPPFTHCLSYSDGITVLIYTIDFNTAKAIELLRSISAPQQRAPPPAAPLPNANVVDSDFYSATNYENNDYYAQNSPRVQTDKP
jgi:hypothetical protein